MTIKELAEYCEKVHHCIDCAYRSQCNVLMESLRYLKPCKLVEAIENDNDISIMLKI